MNTLAFFMHERLDFINKRFPENNEARACISNVVEAMLKYYQVFAKRIRTLPPEPQLSDFYSPIEGQKQR